MDKFSRSVASRPAASTQEQSVLSEERKVCALSQALQSQSRVKMGRQINLPVITLKEIMILL